jgi:type IV secretion system protein TrbG
MRIPPLATILLASVSLSACATAYKPPVIAYDDTPQRAVLEPDAPKPVRIVELPKLLPLPGQLKPVPGAKGAPPRRSSQWRGAHSADPRRVSQRDPGLSLV